MGPDVSMTPDSVKRTLLSRLRSWSPELQESIVARCFALEPLAYAEPEGLVYLRAAAKETIELVAEIIELGESWTPRVPPALAAQVRYLARSGFSSDRVMRGYYATVTVCFEFANEEIGDLPAGALPYLIEIQSQHGDALLGAVSAEYRKELARMDRSPKVQRLAERIQRLLAGESVDTSELDYDFDLWHLGTVITGAKAELAARNLAERLGCGLLLLPRGAETAWAWLGGARAVAFAELEQAVSSRGIAAHTSVYVGEPRNGLRGWRLTHREAKTALAVRSERDRLVRCSDVVLSAAVINDGEAARFLLDAYLNPLLSRGDGEALRATLHAYFDSGCNAASTAAALGVNRHTVKRRLRKVEQCIDRPLGSCRAEMETALRVEQLAGPLT